MKNGDKATVREVYALVQETRTELTGSITRLENKFDLLEAGRLSKLETNFANLRGEIQGKATINAVVISVIIGISMLILNHFVNK